VKRVEVQRVYDVAGRVEDELFSISISLSDQVLSSVSNTKATKMPTRAAGLGASRAFVESMARNCSVRWSIGDVVQRSNGRMVDDIKYNNAERSVISCDR
jgi:hypothetical protein